MNSILSASVQCADVRTIGNAHSHIGPEISTTERTLRAQTSLKALAGAVIERTSARTLPAQSVVKDRTLAAHYESPLHITNQTELPRLVRLLGERYSFTEAEHTEALAVALADPDAALTCFRAMASETAKPSIAATLAPTLPTITGCASCAHSRKPGGVTRYCRARPDLPPAYGEGHPLRQLPDDDGEGCGQWMNR